jgi:hydroxymethylpyrimidine kinase/phosphomethylpyrimidine kinase
LRSRPTFLWAIFVAEELEKLSNHLNVAPPIVLTIAGFDPSAGAGIAADLKTIAAHNCYGVAAVTALTVQSTQGVKSVHDTPAAELRAQLDALLEDIKISAVKIGMLGHRGNAVVVGEFLDRAGVANVVLDPVMKSTSGETDLVDAGGIKFISEELLKRATVVTPNIAEAEVLSGMPIKDHAAMEAAARKIVERGARAVVVKGGHMEKAIDVLFDGMEVLRFASPLARAPVHSIIFTARIRNRPPGASTKFRNTACTPPPNPAPTRKSEAAEPQMRTDKH